MSHQTPRPYYFLGEGRGLTRLSTGEVFFVDTQGQDVGVWIILGGVWETFVDDILGALVRPGDTCLDIGANLGYYTIKMASGTGPNGRVYSFEPNPRMARFVGDNIRINNFDSRSTLVHAAAGAAPGTSTLTFTPRSPGGGTVGLSEIYTQPDQERIDIPVVRVDDVVPADQPAHLIKIDVEGFEPLVLQGMQGLLARSPDCAMVVEVSYNHWAVHGDPAQMVRDTAQGRRIFRIHVEGTIEELAGQAVDAALNRDFVSYILFLPPTEERWNQVKRFDSRVRAEAAAAPPSVAPPVPRLRSRIKRRLLQVLRRL